MTPSDSAAINNGPHLTLSEFEDLFEKTQNWSSFPPQSLERGALNFITPDLVTSAAILIKEGALVPLGLPWNTVSGPDNHAPALHYMSEIGDIEDEQPSCNKDFLAVDYHGKSVTHLDAMTHMAFNDQLFGGAKASRVVNSTGSGWASVDKLGPIMTRGILIDVPKLRNQEWIEPGTAIHKSDVLEAEAKFGFTISQGDCVLLRSGHHARRAQLGAWDPSDYSAGFHYDVMELFKERKVSVIGADGDSDVRPSPVANVHSPIHTLALVALGIPLLDNVNLEQLAQKCEQSGRYEFAISVAPLNVPRGTGSPVNPIAIF